MALYDATSARVYGAALRILRSPVAAEGAARAAYLELWRTARGFDADRWHPMAWIAVALHQAMRNVTTTDVQAAGAAGDS
jgi:RNA polymerase sigma-70 factor (ECF subfamily)